MNNPLLFIIIIIGLLGSGVFLFSNTQKNDYQGDEIKVNDYQDDEVKVDDPQDEEVKVSDPQDDESKVDAPQDDEIKTDVPQDDDIKVNFVDEKINDLISSDQYKNADLEERKNIASEMLEQLEKDEYIKNLFFDERNYLFSFQYVDGSLGGVQLKDFEGYMN